MTDVTDLEYAPQTAGESLARTADNPSAQILRAIEIVEENIREKRSRIEEIQMRQDHLVNEIRQLNKTLELENIDFVPKLKVVINDLDTDGANVELLPDMPVGTEAFDLVRGSSDDKQDKPGSPSQPKKKKKTTRRESRKDK